MAEENEWVEVAMDDDTLVVELLLKLNQQLSPPPLPPPPRRFPAPVLKEGVVLALSVDWSVRQRRSSSSKRVTLTRKLKGSDSSTRASPTTPLSFSGATSVSGGGDGFDEATTSFPFKLTATSRSEVLKEIEETLQYSRSEVAGPGETPTTKRSRRKKTLAELREEEGLLLKERRHLKNKLGSLRATIKEQRATNERLKKLKLDLLSRQKPERFTASVKSETVNPIPPQEIMLDHDPLAISTVCNELEQSPLNAFPQLQDAEDGKSSLLLPDLNLPVEDDSGPNILYGLS